jgi:xylulokinase
VGDHYGIARALVPPVKPNIGVQAVTDAETERLFGIKAGTPIAYRAGDQPNNAFSLNVLDPGEVAATGGTSGVVYGVTDRLRADPQSRVNTFLHVNHGKNDPRYGVLLCINGAGILNAWMKRLAAEKLTYDEVNALCADIPAGSDGLSVLPFGNGAERMLGNTAPGASIAGIDLNRHTRAHVLRAAQEGIAFAFRYGMDVMKGLGVDTRLIRAGRANLLLSPIFRRTLATIADAAIELYDTDGALGAARGAALGAGIYKSRAETFALLEKPEEIRPDPAMRPALDEAYSRWKKALQQRQEKN